MCKCHAKLDRKDQLQLRGLKIVMCGHSLGEICVLAENTCHFGSALTELHRVHVNQSGKPRE